MIRIQSITSSPPFFLGIKVSNTDNECTIDLSRTNPEQLFSYAQSYINYISDLINNFQVVKISCGSRKNIAGCLDTFGIIRGIINNTGAKLKQEVIKSGWLKKDYQLIFESKQ